ncbi:probable cleavage and polyadenylation specificity factor subunit 2 [Schistocerca cancellata]|uniref:probable cleavage and polyadenylation specificity factor subunit 2 n=1 Tax=Schistocerca cancellata TaxID=274614 RepID=UPI0021178606|nr:probable cleavage and polyadenylation specificity factor subunit 2 [Schistocerca cancellata]
MTAVGRGRHDLLVKQETKVQTGFFKSSKKQHPMFPFSEEKVKFDEYGEIIRSEDYKMVDSNPEAEDNKENVEIKEEEVTVDITEVPTKCVSSVRQVHVVAQVQFIDFEGRSDGESLQKILGQLKPRRLILVRGNTEGVQMLQNACRHWGPARVFAPQCGEIVDATTETHIYQVRLTDALVSSLQLKRGKDAELAWIDTHITTREASKDVKPVDADTEKDEKDDDQIYTLKPLPLNQISGHQTAFINELKLSDFKQVLTKANISSEISGGVLWCCNGTVAVRRHDTGRVTLEGCLSEDYYNVRDLLYEQYAIV